MIMSTVVRMRCTKLTFRHTTIQTPSLPSKKDNHEHTAHRKLENAPVTSITNLCTSNYKPWQALVRRRIALRRHQRTRRSWMACWRAMWITSSASWSPIEQSGVTMTPPAVCQDDTESYLNEKDESITWLSEEVLLKPPRLQQFKITKILNKLLEKQPKGLVLTLMLQQYNNYTRNDSIAIDDFGIALGLP